MDLTSNDMPLLERLRKGANCVIFLDGAPEPAADVADMLRKAADEIERLRAEVALWKDRHDSLLADAQRMERSFDEAWHRENG